MKNRILTLMEKPVYKEMYLVEEKMWWFSGLRDILGYYLKKHTKKDDKLLDAGCGTGINLQFFQRLGLNGRGIDLSEDAIAFCQQRGSTNVTKGNITKLPFKKDSFDVIVCIDVLGMLSTTQVKKAIVEMERVLKTGGYLFIQCAAFEWLRSPHDEVTNLKRRFTLKALSDLFNPKDWLFIKKSYRIFFLFFLIAPYKIFKISSQSDLKLPHPFVNAILFAIQKIENYLFRYCNFPIGSSIFLILRKK